MVCIFLIMLNTELPEEIKMKEKEVSIYKSNFILIRIGLAKYLN